MRQADAKFLPLMQQFDEENLDDHPSSVFGFWPNFRLAYVNSAWSRFATENGGEPAISTRWGIGSCLTDAIAPPLRQYYARRLGRCLADGEPWDHVYECSSPDLFRKFHLIVYPLGEGRGGLAVNSLVVERPHDSSQRPASSPAKSSYADRHGIVHQCMHCRRTRNEQQGFRWDWVPAWVAQCPPSTSHGLCPTCVDFHYPELKEELATTAT